MRMPFTRTYTIWLNLILAAGAALTYATLMSEQPDLGRTPKYFAIRYLSAALWGFIWTAYWIFSDRVNYLLAM